MKYVATTARRFDVIIVDSTDPQGPGKVLFSRKFYAACKRCLNKGGLLVTQNGVPIFQPNELVSSVGKFRRLFADGTCYVAAVPTYIGGHMAMGWATDDKQLAPGAGQDNRGAPPQGRELHDQILDAGGARRRVRPAPLYCRPGRSGEVALVAARG